MLPIVQTSYPHMMAEDVAVWSEFLKDPPIDIEGVWYDLHVGRGISPVDTGDVLARRIAAGISRKRIDVVALIPQGFLVVEIKPVASFLALGQALAYSRLFVLEYQPTAAVMPCVVCGQADEDLVEDFEELHVVLIIV